MIDIVKHSIRFILFLITQAFVFNQIELGLGIQLMVYPLFIFLLPLELNVFAVMLISFGLGYGIDFFSNTYGLHASAAILIAYLRPFLLKFFEPREGYLPGNELSLFAMGYPWYMKVYSIFLGIHLTWFFLLEQFKWSEFWLIVLKTSLSLPISLGLSILFQLSFFKKPANR